MASLGNLYFGIGFNMDPKELDEIKKRALEQLKELEVKFNMSATLSKEDLAKQVNEILNKEHKVNISVDKEKLSTEVKGAVSKTEDSQSITSQAEAYRDLESAINSIIGTRGQNIKRLVDEKNALANVQSQLRIYEKQQQEGIVFNKDQLKNKTSLINKEFEHKQAISELNQLIKSDVKLSQSAATSMDEMSLTLTRMKVAYKGLSDEMKLSPFGRQLEAQIQTTDAALKKMDASIGNHQRNVGNYKTQWDGLQFQVTQLAREIPSMAYGMNVFFAAISNNWPMLADEIKKAKLEYNALKEAQAQGMNLNRQAIPVWKQLLSSVVSWQTALLVLTTLLITKWGVIEKWVKGLFSIKTGLDAAKESTRQFSEAIEESNKSVGSEITKLKLLYEAVTNANTPLEDRNKIISELQKMYPSYFNNLTSEDFLAGKAADSYERLSKSIISAARARAVADKIAENQSKMFGLEDELEKMEKNYIGAIDALASGSWAGSPMVNVFKKRIKDYKDVEDELSSLKQANDKLAGKIDPVDLVIDPKPLDEKKKIEKSNDPLREKLNLLKSINSEYRSWAAIVGEDRAVNIVRDIFETPDFDPSTYRDDLMKILNSANDQTVRIDAAKTLTGLDKESIEETLKETERYISDTVKGWDLFSELFKESKDYNFSINAAFGGDVAFKSVLEQLEADIRKELEGNKYGITFDEIIKLDPSEVGKRFDGQMAAYVKTYQEQSKKISDESLKNSAKLLKTYRDYEDQRKDIIAKGEQEVADLIANGASAQAIEMANEATSKALNKLQDDVLNKYGLGDYAAKGNVSDLFKNRIRESLPLFKNISSATLSELNKAKEVVGSMKIPPQLLVDFKKAGGDAEKLAEIIKEAQDNANEALDDRMLNKIVDSVNKLTNSIGKLGGALQKFDNKNLKGIGEFFESVSGGMGDILEFAKLGKNATKMDVISLGISGVATIIDTATTAINKNIEAQKEWSEAIEDSLQKMRMYNIEQLAYKQNSIFGMDSPIAPAISAIKQYEKSVESLLEIEKKLGEGLVQTGSKKVPSGSAVGGFVVGGAALGGAIGSIVPVIGTALGAVIGGLLGGLAAGIGSLFGSKATTKTVPIFENLKDHYGELFDTKTFELNPKILADYEKMDEETKKIIDNWGEIRQAMIEANEQIEETLKNIAGSIGEDLYSALINAFRNKDLTAALNEFKSSVNKILSDLAARMLFNAVFSETLKKGEKRMKESLNPGGDQDLIDDIDWLGDELEKGMPVFLEGLEGLKEMLKGFDRELDFGDSDTGRGLSAGIKGITEDTASLLASYANSMRADGAVNRELLSKYVNDIVPEMSAMAKAQLTQLMNISQNTAKSADNTEEIIDFLKSVSTGAKKLWVR